MNKKFPKWRVGLSFTQYFMVEVDAPTEETAIERAWIGACYESDKVETGSSSSITSVSICDKEAREFAHYVPEVYPKEDSSK
ncbi:MAG: hypothetical protein K2Y01_02245 [Rhabdochlamydiaceae bacterium]|nr:hypothetical protein [Rhabdochlamydiaceae bacterium]